MAREKESEREREFRKSVLAVWHDDEDDDTDCFQRSFSGVVANLLDCGIVVSEFELQSHYYIHFRTDALAKVRTPFLPEGMG